MTARELRIGNYIDRNGLMEVRAISQSGVKIYDHVNNIFPPTFFDFDENIKPIPLTEEWLLKFGFKRVDMMFENASMLYWRKDDFIINDERNVILFNDKETMMKIHCEYVHTLQNLFFVLSGEELVLVK